MAVRHWTADPTHSTVAFKVRHMMFSKVRGHFGRWQARVAFDPADLASATIEASVETASIDTGTADRDAHLRSADFFDSERVPAMTFRSRAVSAKGDALRIEGDLTIRDVTLPVTLEGERTGSGVDPWGNQRHGFAVSTRIHRKDFGLTWNAALEAGGVLVGDEVEIEVEVQLVPAAA